MKAGSECFSSQGRRRTSAFTTGILPQAGFAPAELERELETLLTLPRLDVRGLMTVGFFTGGGEAARPTFARLRRLSERLRAGDERLGEGLSMGMTDDYEVAIEEGSTLVRVGRALFGERPAEA